MDELPPASEAQLTAWRAEQARISSLVVTHDAFDWSVDSAGPLFLAGTDVSFSATSATEAVVTVTVVRLVGSELRIVFSRSRRVALTTPYASSFLAFREAPLAAQLFHDLPRKVRDRLHALLVDGNGVLHPRAAGLASHLGLALDLPAIGVTKSLFCMDGLDESAVRKAVVSNGEVDLVGESGRVWGRAILTGNATAKPVFVSVGHRFDIESAVRLVRRLCRFRVPEPIRVADLHSREALRTGKLVDVWNEDVFGGRENVP